MKAFCTLFDSNYMSRGLAMYESLINKTPDSHLYIFPFDGIALDALKKLNLPRATIVAQAEFEDEELLRVKPTRSRAEYCWTCTPSIIRHCLLTYHLDVCTYVDADIMFYGDCTPLLEEMGSKDAMIIEHRYTPRVDSSATSGIYNVQFMPFRSTPAGMRVLNWWRDACIESCELNPAEGKCGDQKYLDDWTERFDCVHVLQHLGGGVAPWNIEQYTFIENAAGTTGFRKADNLKFPLVFFHFHAFRFHGQNRVELCPAHYVFDKTVVPRIYAPYVAELVSVAGRLRERGFTFDPHGAAPASPWIERTRRFLARCLRKLRGQGANDPATPAVRPNRMVRIARRQKALLPPVF
jgi:hypothetical protein